MIVAGTGHRPGKLGGYDEVTFTRLTSLARGRLRELKPEKVISGMALGWDQAVANAALDLHIPLIAAVPFDGFEARWTHAQQDRFSLLLDQSDEVETCSPYPGQRAYQLRNEWMVDRANLMLALWDGSWGGTFNCIRYAEKVGRPVENLWDQWEAGSLLV